MNTKKLSELAYLFNGKTRPKSYGRIPVYGGNGIIDYVSENNASKDTIIIGRVGAYCGNVNMSDSKCWVTDNAIGINAMSSVDARYLYYALISKNLAKYSGGSGQPLLTQNRLRNIVFEIPEIEEQKSIARKIGTFDSKLKLNNNLITHLEEYSQRIYHKWFVDFNFPDKNGHPYKDGGGEMVEVDGKMMPKGWTTQVLSESADFINGLAMQSYPPQNENDLLPVIKIKEINNNGFHKDTEYMTKSIDQNLIIKNGDILFPWSGSLSVNIWSGGIGGLNQHIFKVQSEKYENWFLYQWIKRHMRYFEQIAYGKKTTMGHINRKHLSMVDVLVPDTTTLNKMNEIMVPLYLKVVALREENQLLEETRDLLIKKLIK